EPGPARPRGAPGHPAVRDRRRAAVDLPVLLVGGDVHLDHGRDLRLPAEAHLRQQLPRERAGRVPERRPAGVAAEHDHRLDRLRGAGDVLRLARGLRLREVRLPRQEGAVRAAHRHDAGAREPLAGAEVRAHVLSGLGGGPEGPDHPGRREGLRAPPAAAGGARADELVDSARIDGGGFFTMYRRVAVPLLRGGLAFLGIFTFITAWNDYVWPLIILVDPERQTLQTALQNLNSVYLTDYG